MVHDGTNCLLSVQAAHAVAKDISELASYSDLSSFRENSLSLLLYLEIGFGDLFYLKLSMN